MFKKEKNKPRIKSKTILVKSKSLIGKTEMDKALEKYTNSGWELISKTKVRNKDRYTLQFQYEMSAEEIAKEDRFNLIRNVVIGSFLFLCCGISYFQGQAIQRQEATESVYASQTATLWTSTPTSTPTLIPSPTLTPSITPSATITNTPAPTNTTNVRPSATITNTPLVTSTQSVADLPRTTYYIIAQANIRDCAGTTCKLIETLFTNQELEITDDNFTGESYANSTRWMQGTYNGQVVYVHSSLVSRTQLATPVPAAPSSNTSNTGNVPASSSCSCSADIYNCTNGSFSSRSEAQACFDKCMAEGRGDIHGLDGNNDGNICESGVD